jgi:hypothetical protein
LIGRRHTPAEQDIRFLYFVFSTYSPVHLKRGAVVCAGWEQDRQGPEFPNRSLLISRDIGNAVQVASKQAAGFYSVHFSTVAPVF